MTVKLKMQKWIKKMNQWVRIFGDFGSFGGVDL